MRVVKTRPLLAAALLLYGCASSDPRLPDGALPVPLVRQAHPYSCGAAALLGVLFYWQAEDSGEAALYKDLATTEEDGTAPEGLVRGARSHGLTAGLRRGLTVEDLRRALARGETAIVDIQAWREDEKIAWKDRWEDGHYVVLVAMDERYAYFMDPSTCASYGWIPLEELLDRWHDCENRTGKRVDYVHAAVIIRGKNPLARYPAEATRIE